MGRQWMTLALAGALAVTLTACGAGEDKTGDMTNQTSYARTGRAGYAQDWRTASDYMKDARYSAGSDGQVHDRDSSTARDFTQDARDMLRDAGDAVKDAGKDVRNAAKDIMNQ